MLARASSDSVWRALPWAVAVVFIVITAPKLAHLRPNVDEGVYILQARLVRQGEIPYVDFFYHQTPLYLYALAAYGALAGDSLAGCRFLSLLATALTGVLVFHAGRRLRNRSTGLLAELAFYAAPIELYGFLALPNALTGLLAAFGAFAVLLRDRLGWSFLGGVALALAVLVKPLAVPIVLAVVLTLVLVRRERRKLPALVSSGLLTGLAAWGLLHLATGGAFTEVLRLQAHRYSGRSGFELMASYPDFRDAVIARNATTPTRWNWSEHTRAFLSGGLTNGNFWLLLAAIGSIFLWRRRESPPRLLVLLLTWLFGALYFSLYVWEPIWDHYFVLYLPPLALFAALTLDAALGARRRLAKAGAILLLVGVTVLGHTQRFTDPYWYRQAAAVGERAKGRALFTFNPVIQVVAGTQPACGLIDPLNVYGEHAIAALDPAGPMSRFQITAEALAACLGDETPVVIDDYAFWFLEPPLVALLERTPERLIFFGTDARRRFDTVTRAASASPRGPRE